MGTALQYGRSPAQRLLTGISRGPFKRWIHIFNPALGICNNNVFRGLVHGGGQAHIVRGHASVFPVITDHEEKSAYIAVLVKHPGAHGCRSKPFPVPAAVTGFIGPGLFTAIHIEAFFSLFMVVSGDGVNFQGAFTDDLFRTPAENPCE